MVTIDRPRVWPVLLLLTAIMLVHPPSARADRIDIDDPSVLGPVVLSDEIYDATPLLKRSCRGSIPRRDLLVYLRCFEYSPYFPVHVVL